LQGPCGRAEDIRETSRTVTDARQKTVEIPPPFRGVVILPFVGGTILTEFLTVTRDPRQVLAASKIRGTEAHDLLARAKKIFPGIGEIRDDISDASIHPNFEAMLRLDPSAVIQWEDVPGENAFMERVGLKVVTIHRNREAEWIPQTAPIFAGVGGTAERGRMLAADFREAEEALARELQAIPLAGRPRVARLWVSPTGRITAMGRGRFSPDWISRGGGVQAAPAQSDWVPLDLERLYLLDPDVILLTAGEARPLPADLFARREWQALRAVKTRRVYWEPCLLSYLVDYPLSCRWLAELLHPDRISPGLRDTIKHSYSKNLNYCLSDSDLDSLLAVAENKHSAGYERFNPKKNLR